MPHLEQLLSPIITNIKSVNNIDTAIDEGIVNKIKKQKAEVLNKLISPLQVDSVRPEIVQSWLRSQSYGLNFNIYSPPPILDQTSFQKLLKKKENFIQAADFYINQLESILADVECYTFITDEDGVLLKASKSISNNDLQLLPGTIWAEKTIGTCSSQMCILLNSPIQLCGPEHYCRIFNHISCSSAPVYNTEGKLEGTLTITSPYFHCQNPHTLGLVVLMANIIQKELQLYINNRMLKIALSNEKNAVFVVNKDGIISDSNCNAQQIFKSLVKDLTYSSISEIIENNSLLDSVLKNNVPIENKRIFINKLKKSFICSIQPIGNNENNFGCIVNLWPIEPTVIRSKTTHGLPAEFTLDKIIGDSKKSKETKELAKRCARFKTNVLILGESGTGKEIYAQAIHNESCPDGPFVAVNCAAIPRNLIESELFGYEAGAFTGAERQGKPGKIELANGGTLFLDEIGDMPFELQAVLLRVLEDRKVMRLGSSKYIPVDFRLITATNRNLVDLMKNGLFREDLYYRISVFQIKIPPLRERGSDIIQLIDHFLNSYASMYGQEKPVLSNAAKYILLRYNWPGNVRQLQNVISHAICMINDSVICPEHLPEEVLSTHALAAQENHETKDELVTELLEDDSSVSNHSGADTGEGLVNNLSVKDMEEIVIKKALNEANNLRDAAKILGISKSTLYRRVKDYRIPLKKDR
jgi:transcriptional regulator with PAS, ATPase and Fis domain